MNTVHGTTQYGIVQLPINGAVFFVIVLHVVC
jgi:hypothetical protein